VIILNTLYSRNAMSDSEGEYLIFSLLYVCSLVDLFFVFKLIFNWLDIARDHGMYNYFMNKDNWFIIETRYCNGKSTTDTT